MCKSDWYLRASSRGFEDCIDSSEEESNESIATPSTNHHKEEKDKSFATYNYKREEY